MPASAPVVTEFPHTLIMPEISASDWNQFLSAYPNTHLLQTAAWGDLKAAFGWEVVRLVEGSAGAQILLRRLAAGLSLAYIPKGPVGEGCDSLYPALDKICRTRHAAFLKVEPDQWLDSKSPADTPPPKFRPSPHAIQPLRTLVLDITQDESTILAQMKPKTRYNIRLAQRKGVVIRSSGDIDTFSDLMEITARRDRFGVHTREYYQMAYDLFHPRNGCELLMAEYQGEPLAGLMVFANGIRAWYFYGASSDRERNRMPTYLLQWEAIRWAQAHGCRSYDLWGVPDEDAETLEKHFSTRSGGLWGIYRFKRGFGGELRRASGPWDRVYQPVLYTLYRWWAGRRGME